VPYKAFDGLVDSVSRYLSRLAPDEVHNLLPRDIDSLARVFPVLRRATARLPGPSLLQIPDPRELRRRAFAALRELLTRLGRHRHIVLSIDDLQWAISTA